MKNKNRTEDDGDSLVSHEGNIVGSQALSEEEVKPRKLAPQPAHRMVPDLIVDVVEGRLQDQARGTLTNQKSVLVYIDQSEESTHLTRH